MGGGVGPTAGPDVLEKRQTSTVPRFEPRAVQSLAQSLYRLSNPIPFKIHTNVFC